MRALLVDDKPGIRRMLRHLLELRTSLDVVAEASSSEQALAVTATVKPDVVIMDIELPGMNATSATRELRRQHPEMRALAFSSICDDATREAMKKGGAEGFLVLLLNERSPDELAYELQSAKNAPPVTLLSPWRESLVAITRSAFPGRGSGRSLRHSSVRRVVKDERAASHGRRES